MFKIRYGVNTEDKFNYSTRTAIELVLSDMDNISLDDVFEAIGEMIDSSYEKFIDRNTQLFGFGLFGEEVTVTIISLTNNSIELELHY